MKLFKLLSFIIAVFFFIISITISYTVYYESKFFYCLSFSILIIIFLYVSINNGKTLKELTTNENIVMSQNKVNLFFLIFLIPILSLVIHTILNKKIDQDLDKNGIVVTGNISEQSITTYTRTHVLTQTSNSNQTYDLIVTFYDSISKKEYVTTQSVNEQFFKNLHSDSKVQVLYLKDYPNINKILDTKVIPNNTTILTKDFTYNDIIKIKDLKSPNEILEYLKSLDSGWVLSNDEEVYLLENSRLQLNLVFETTDKMILFSNNLGDFIPENDFIIKEIIKNDSINPSEMMTNKGIKSIPTNNYIGETQFFIVEFTSECYLKYNQSKNNKLESNCEGQIIFEKNKYLDISIKI